MSDFLNLNINLEDISMSESPDDGWTTNLVEGTQYHARVTNIQSHVNDANIGYMVDLEVLTDPNATSFSGTTEACRFNYVWAGRNGGTADSPRWEKPVDKEGKQYIPRSFLSFANSLGERVKQGGKFNLEAGVGAIVLVTVKHDEYNGNVNAKVDRWKASPLNSGATPSFSL